MTLELISRTPQGTPQPTPLLFVHGAWHAAWCWDDYFLPYFAAQGYAAYALSFRGHGSSSGSQRHATIADYVADVAQIAASLPQPPVMIGHSLGGFVVQHYLMQHSAPAGVLLASIPPHGALRTTLNSALHQPLDAVQALLSWSLYPFVGTPAKARHHLFSASLPDADLQRHFHRIEHESFRSLLDICLLTPVRPERNHTPMLVMGAANDNVFTVKELHATAQAYRTQAVIVPNMAHDMMLEAGWQSVAQTVVEWLRGRGM
jgi:pimeloyl-ACP methyl ester carboxylesterase